MTSGAGRPIGVCPALEATYGAISARSDMLHNDTIRNWFDRLDLVTGSVKTGLVETVRRTSRGLLDIGDKLFHGLFGLATDQDVRDCTIRNWFDTLDLVKGSVKTGLVEAVRRTRRGLLDIGDRLLHGLFGLATDQDVRDCRELIARAGESNSRIVHTVNQLVSVLNNRTSCSHAGTVGRCVPSRIGRLSQSEIGFGSRDSNGKHITTASPPRNIGSCSRG